MEPTDRELVDEVVRGDQGAFALLFAHHRGAVCQHVLGILRDPACADDLTQEVFLRLWRRAGQWRAEAALRTWLLRIATNLALNHLRAVKRRREQPLEIHPACDPEEEEEESVPAWMIDTAALPPDEAVAQVERRGLLRRAVGQLSEAHQEVVRLVVDAHLETREVAAELGLPEGTVKSRMYHARKQIARSWLDLGIDWEDLS